MVIVHQNCCGNEDGYILEDDNDRVWLDSFSSIAKAKKNMKTDIKEFKEIYPDAVVVTDLGGLRATVELPITNENDKPDTFIVEWKIVKI